MTVYSDARPETVDGPSLAAAVSKLPAVGALFWAIKIVATTLGESASNFVAMEPLNLGYAAASVIFLVTFAVTLSVQLRASRFRPVVFWSVILTTSIVGTAMSDLVNRTAGVGYTGGALILTTLLALVLLGWRATGETMNVERIDSTKAEILYWTATLVSNTLGTSSGDFLADELGIGFRDSVLVLGGAMLLILAAHYLTRISGTLLFWAAYVLTRPLGAVAENAVEKPVDDGGLGVGTTITSGALLAVLVGLVGYQMWTGRGEARLAADEQAPGDHGGEVAGRGGRRRAIATASAATNPRCSLHPRRSHRLRRRQCRTPRRPARDTPRPPLLRGHRLHKLLGRAHHHHTRPLPPPGRPRWP